MNRMMWKTEEVAAVYLAALCAWREARGEGSEGMRAVLHVIKNRSRSPGWWGANIVDVILKPSQFSCFLPGDPNAVKFPASDDAVFAQALDLAANVIAGQDEDLTGGADHYHEQNVFPAWASKMTRIARIGRHLFYRSK